MSSSRFLRRPILAVAAGAIVLAWTAACRDGNQPMEPPPQQPKLPPVQPPAPVIRDAAHSDEVDHFYFLPPLVPQPLYDGTFDPSLSPVIQICVLDGEACDDAQPPGFPILFTTTTGPGSETVRMVPEDEHYIVNWHTDEFSLDAARTYRIIVSVTQIVLGFADVDVVNNGSELRNVNTGEFVPLKDGRTLPIKVRIEEGAVFVISAEEGGVVEALGGEVTLEIPPGAVSEETGITVEAAEPTGEAVTAVEFGPDGLQFDKPITVTLAYDPSALPPGVTEEELGFHLQVGDPAEGRWFFQAGSMVDPVTNTVSAPLSHFSTGGVAPVRLEPAASVAAAGSFTCAVNPDGQAFCWGRDNAGALGTNQTTATCKELGSPVGDSPIVTDPCSTVPMPVEGQIVFSQVSAADNSVCGVTTANDVYCWGRTLEAAFVAGDLPALVPGGTLFSQIDVGFRYACGTTTEGALACWGRNNFGQLGDGSTTESSSPVAVAGGVPLVSVDAGFWHSCGLTGLGEPFCWGRALFGVFGDGGVSPDSPLPVSAASGLTLAEIEPGTVFTCGLEPDGTAHCWGGFNQFVGQHGTGTFANSNVPVPVAGGLSFADVEAHSHNNVFGVNCGITTSGAAYCWGNDSNGQLGVGGAGNVCSTVVGDVACEIAPVAVTGGLTFAELSVGGLHVCGRTPAGELYCWGWNAWGQLGDGTQTDSNVPVRVASPVGG